MPRLAIGTSISPCKKSTSNLPLVDGRLLIATQDQNNSVFAPLGLPLLASAGLYCLLTCQSLRNTPSAASNVSPC